MASIVGSNQPSRQSQMIEVLQNLKLSIDGIEENFKRLHERLRPVSYSKPKTETGGKPEKPCYAEIPNVIFSEAQRISLLNSLVLDLIEDLEI